jgi:hypothetical protein
MRIESSFISCFGTIAIVDLIVTATFIVIVVARSYYFATIAVNTIVAATVIVAITIE